MEKKNKQLIKKGEDIEDDLLFDTNITASATECTGLIQTPPLTEDEAEAYTDLYAIPQPDSDNAEQPDKLKKK